MEGQELLLYQILAGQGFKVVVNQRYGAEVLLKIRFEHRFAQKFSVRVRYLRKDTYTFIYQMQVRHFQARQKITPFFTYGKNKDFLVLVCL